MQDDGYFSAPHDRLCDKMQEQLEAAGVLQELRHPTGAVCRDVRFRVVMPRGSLKSTIITKYLPLWLSIQGPEGRNMRFLIACNSAPNAARKLEDIRGVLDGHDTFMSLWPDLLPTKDCRWTNAAAELNRTKRFPEATFEAAGVRTKLTSRHYNCIIEDDTVSPDESDMGIEMSMPSIEDIEKGIGWHKQATPLLVPRGPRIRIVVSTRWTDFDLMHYIEENETSYHSFDVPALDEMGQPNFPELLPLDTLEDYRKLLGPYMFAALYLNAPIPAGERNFRPEWFQYFTRLLTDSEGTRDTIPADATFYVSIDPAISEKDAACETAIVGCWHKLPLIYVTETLHGHFTPQDTITKTLDLVEKHYDRCGGIIVETVQYQKALRYFMLDEMRRRRMYKPIVESNSRTAKEIRIQALQPLFANKQILFDRTLDRKLESQLLQFPNGRLVDIADALAQHLDVYRGVFPDPVVVKRDEPDPNSLVEIVKQIKRRNSPEVGSYFYPAQDDPIGEYIFGGAN